MSELEDITKRIPDDEKTPEFDSAKKTSSSSPGKQRAVATQAETLEWHSKRWGSTSSSPLLPGAPCPAFSTLAVLEDEKTTFFSLESFKTPYVVVLFLPLIDEVDTAELAAFSKEVSLSFNVSVPSTIG